jgi:DNA helicase HerA-like ATPase
MMERKQSFRENIINGYSCKGDFIMLGGAMLDGECIPETYVKVPLKMINRHGLIAGATGTGKTKTLQVIAEQLSEKGVPVILMDLKGDLSGLAQPGEEKEFITKRLPGLASPIRRNLCPLS